MRTVQLPDKTSVSVLGQGTWKMGEATKNRTEEVAALRFGMELGMTLIDTAEMYAEGGAEEVVAEAIEGQRESVFLVT
jgi:aryl-alcohol dehydrogenase-like predicted oxidoreductase